MTTPPPAGWYPPPPQPPPSEPARITIHYGFALLAIFSLLGTVIPSIILFSLAGNIASDKTVDPDSASTAAGMSSGAAILWLLWGGMWTLIWAAFAINHTLKERRRNR